MSEFAVLALATVYPRQKPWLTPKRRTRRDAVQLSGMGTPARQGSRKYDGEMCTCPIQLGSTGKVPNLHTSANPAAFFPNPTLQRGKGVSRRNQWKTTRSRSERRLFRHGECKSATSKLTRRATYISGFIWNWRPKSATSKRVSEGDTWDGHSCPSRFESI